MRYNRLLHTPVPWNVGHSRNQLRCEVSTYKLRYFDQILLYLGCGEVSGVRPAPPGSRGAQPAAGTNSHAENILQSETISSVLANSQIYEVWDYYIK